MSDGLSDSLRWALALGTDPERALVDWMAHELVPEADDAASAISVAAPDSAVDRRRLDLLKSGFKSLRVSAESAADRRLAARCYAATIAAGVVRHRVWITRQRTERVIAALQDLAEDTTIARVLRDLAIEAIAIADGQAIPVDSTPES